MLCTSWHVEGLPRVGVGLGAILFGVSSFWLQFCSGFQAYIDAKIYLLLLGEL